MTQRRFFQTPAVAVLTLMTAALCILRTSPLAADEQLTLIDGSSRAGVIESIDTKGQIKLAGVSAAIDLQSLRRIARDTKSQSIGVTPFRIHLATGGTLLAKTAVAAEEKFQIDWKYGKGLALPIEAIGAIHLPGSLALTTPAERASGVEAYERAMANRGEKDQILARRDGKVVAFAGLIEKVTDKHVTFTASLGGTDVTRDFPLEEAYAVVMAQIGPPTDRLGTCLIRLRDGSSLSGHVTGLSAGKLTLQPAADVNVALPWADVVDADVRSDRLLFLSDLKPTQAIHRPLLVALPREWKADRNVVGGRLVLGKKTYAKGIGVQSFSRLAFDRDKRFGTLAVTIGIDDDAHGPASCVFVIEGDDKELLRQKISTGDKPKAVRVDVSGATKIKLIVEPGDDLDLADHANWCDARLLKTAEGK